MGYPTVDEIVADSDVAALTGASAAEQARLWRASVAAVEEFCQQKFVSEAKTERLDGPGGRRLYLPRRLSALTSLQVFRSTLTEADVLIAENGAALDISTAAGWGGNYYERCARDADFRSGADPDLTFGYGTILITGVWGWTDAEFPPEVKDALRRDMEDTALVDKNKLTPTIRQYRHLGVRDIAQGNMRASLTGAPGLSPDAQQLLSGLVWTPPLGANV